MKKDSCFLKKLTIESIVLLAITCVGMFCVPFLQAKECSTKESQTWKIFSEAREKLEPETRKNDNTGNLPMSVHDDMTETEEPYVEKVRLSKKNSEAGKINKKTGSSYIRIKKAGMQEVWGHLEHDYMKRQVAAVFYGNFWKEPENTDIVVVWKGKRYEIQEKEIPLTFHFYKCQRNDQAENISDKKETEQYNLLLEFDADKIFSYQLLQDKNYVYITFYEPREIYDKVVVVDAGHGGKDTGTYAVSGEWDEKEFNLDFVEKVKDSWNHKNIKLYFTRLEDKKVGLSERVEFANQLQADLYVSIHCNSSDDSMGTGLEALYKSDAYAEDSKSFARQCMKTLSECTGLTNRGVLDGNSIYIIRNTNMPTVLLELGFLSNPEDLEYLSLEENREKMAESIGQLIWERFAEDR